MELYKGDEGSSSSNTTSISEAIFQTFHASAPPDPDHLPQYTDNIINDGVVAAASGHRVATTVESAVVESGGGLISQLQGFNIFPSQSLPLPIAVLPCSTIFANSSHQLYSSTITATNNANSHDIPPIYHYHHQQQHDHGRLLYSSLLPPPHMPLYGSDMQDISRIRTAAALQLGQEGAVGLLPHMGIPTGFYMGGSGGGVSAPDETLFRGGQGMITSSTSLGPFSCLQSELGKMSAQETMDAKALAASKSHSEAERRRRERINTHLARLRSLLPNTTKTDKASLLAEVIQHVKELKRQAAQIVEQIPVPTESDELTVYAANEEDGKFVVKASMCCDDRSDLLTELIKALKALRLRTLKAEITTLGGRVKNVLVVTEEDDCGHSISIPEETNHHSITSIQDALKAVMDRASTPAPDTNNNDPSSSSSSANKGTGTSVKKQRTTHLSSIMEKR